MHLVKELNTGDLSIQIYSTNPDLNVDVAASLFEGMTDEQIQHVVFNEIGAEQVNISNNARFQNARSYAVA